MGQGSPLVSLLRIHHTFRGARSVHDQTRGAEVGSLIRHTLCLPQGLLACRRLYCPTEGSPVDFGRSNLPHGSSAKALRQGFSCLRWRECGLQGAQDCLQDVPKWHPRRPQRVQKASKFAQDASKMSPDGLKTLQDGLRTAQDASRTAQEGSQMRSQEPEFIDVHDGFNDVSVLTISSFRQL